MGYCPLILYEIARIYKGRHLGDRIEALDFLPGQHHRPSAQTPGGTNPACGNPSMNLCDGRRYRNAVKSLSPGLALSPSKGLPWVNARPTTHNPERVAQDTPPLQPVE
jgi:hypothetical protein